MNRIVTWSLGALLPLGLAILIGCSSGSNTDKMLADAYANNLQRLATMYSLYAKNNDWLGPENKQQLMEFIGRQDTDRMSKMGIDVNDLNPLFVGERDNQEFKIRWAMQDRFRGPPLPVIFEANGADGNYQIGFTGNMVKEVDKTEYDRLWNQEFDVENAQAPARRR